jgi:hypothetical protein
MTHQFKENIMYKIDADKDKKLIRIELSGHMQSEELKKYNREIFDAINRFCENEVLILASMVRLDPISQENLPACIENLAVLSARIKKIAFVHKRVVTRMQQERIVKEANRIAGRALNAKNFNAEADALRFLYG